MKIVTHPQNSKNWYAWRKRGLGASNAPVVMDASPWTSRFELWLELTGMCERAPANEFAIAAMRRGTELEPAARMLAEGQLGLLFPSVSAEHSEYEFIRASFDGYNEETNTILEIKCPNKVDHAGAIAGKVPAKYYAQLQQQLFVSGATKCYYASWDGRSERVAIVEVLPDQPYIDRLVSELKAFWLLVETQQPPKVTPKDLEKFAKRVSDDVARLQSSSRALTMAVGV